MALGSHRSACFSELAFQHSPRAGIAPARVARAAGLAGPQPFLQRPHARDALISMATSSSGYDWAPGRRFFDKVTRDGKAPWDAARDGPRFMSAVLEFQDDPVDLLYRLTNTREHGCKRLRDALSSSNTPTFINTYVVPFLALLGGDKLCRGSCKPALNQVVELIYNLTGLMECLLSTLESNPQLPKAEAIGWFLLSAASLLEHARTDPTLPKFIQPLQQRGGAAAAAAAQLKVILAGAAGGQDRAGDNGSAAGTGSMAIEDLAQQAGGRHDNDHADYRSIRLMPSSDEVLSRTAPYLPRHGDLASADLADASPEAAVLDRQFRLLREDMLGPLRKELADLGLVQEVMQDADGGVTGVVAMKPTPHHKVAAVSRNVFRNVAVLGTSIKPRPCIIVSVALPPGHKASPQRMPKHKDREEYWNEFGRGTLPTDALVCIACAGQPLAFASVVRREPKELAADRSIIGIHFESKEDAQRVLSCMGHGPLQGVSLLQVSAGYFSVKPVLKCLQHIPTVPLADQLVHGRPPAPVDYLPPEVIEQELSTKVGSLDPSQMHALHASLTSNVSLIQGPPGTGKTFVGALLCDIINRCSSARILVVCYTNHALDQFLEYLLDKGIKDIVRVGGRSKSKRLEPYNLRELSFGKNNNNSRTQAENRRFWQLMDTSRELEKKVLYLSEPLIAMAPGPPNARDAATVHWHQHQKQQAADAAAKEKARREAKGIAEDDNGLPVWEEWDEMSRYLKDEHPDVYSQLEVPKGFRGVQYLWKRWLWGNTDKGLVENWQPGGGGGGSDWKQQKQGKRARRAAPGADGQLVPAAAGIWALPRRDRWLLVDQWRSGLRQRLSEDLADALARAEAAQLERRSLDEGSMLAVLNKARVIGITTTGAAMHKELLASVKPEVVLVEEVGELLEAHVLTSLSQSTKHLIMIGDHKQLRPKVESYELSVQSGKGHDLNVSCFERLVVSGFPHSTLAVQHRMHPDISTLVRQATYPSLEDHPKTAAQPPVKGMVGRVVFLDHRQPELQEGQGGPGWGASHMHQSKVNMHEVQLTVAVARYMLQQGYAPEQLVVLTPYLGQLVELQRAMSQEFQVLLDELDLRDLRAAAAPEALVGIGAQRGPESGGQGGAGSSVRLSTIDNYQGEEADIVIASLVRSNSDGSVGFLREPERINVLVSRARHGMVLIGNSDTLRNAKNPAARKHWGQLLDMLQSSGSIHAGLPAVCQTHGTPVKAVLSTREAFEEHVPHGGCSMPCNQKLPCGHICTLRCHAYDLQHERVRCRELVYSYCDKGHLTTRECSDVDAGCTACAEITRLEEQEKKKMKELEAEAARQRAKAEKERVRVEAQIEGQRKKLAALEEARVARQAAVKLELESARLAHQVALQEKLDKSELAAWEDEAHRQAQADMDEAAADAAKALIQQQAEREAAAQLEKIRREEAKMQRKAEMDEIKLQQMLAKQQADLAKQQAELAKVDKELDRGLQRIENQKNQLAAQTDVRKVRLTTALISISMWKQEVVRAAAAGVPGLQALRQRFLEAAAADDSVATALDDTFEIPGIGAKLTQRSTPEAVAAAAQSLAPFKRGLQLIKDKKWIEARDVFVEAVKQQQAPGAGLAQSFLTLCDIMLGELPAAPVQLIKLPMAKGNGSPARKHPVQHLVDALVAARSQRGSNSVSGATAQRKANAQAVGHALAYLLSPETSFGLLPPSLQDEALSVLQGSAPSLTSALPLPSAVADAATAGSSNRIKPGWEQLKKKSQAFGKMLDLVGLTPVKDQVFNLASMVELDQERKRDPKARSYHVLFYGNPGTGKTTVARLYAALLEELKILPKSKFVETSGSGLLTGGVSELKKHLKELEEGGVLFIDEAYQLNPKTNISGAQVLDYLLPEMENKRGSLVVVLAGYQKPMEGLLGHNEGLPSRFNTTFTFPDYSDTELFTIFKGVIASDSARFSLADEKHARIAARRLGRQRGAIGFGNARAVRNLWEATITRQSARVVRDRAAGANPDPLLITREDLLGPKHLDTSTSAPLRQLAGMHGLKMVKDSVNTLLGLIVTNAELEEAEMPLKEITLNRVFLGNPGTGKTTVANIYGRILYDLGLLSKGDVVVKNPADFIGEVLGESEKKTSAILDATVGCVLVIDEAYGLHPSRKSADPYKEAVIDTIVAKVQGVPGDDRCVLLLGYQEQMETMLREANPGLARRFQLSQAWQFEDYSDQDLWHIMKAAAANRYGWQLGGDELRAGIRALDRERRKPNFGNAGAVNNLLAAAAQRMEARLKDLPPAQRMTATPVAADLFPEETGAADPAAIFEDLIGCREVMEKLKEWQATIKMSQSLGQDPLKSFELNFLFTGSPGTGKTTVARRVGQLFQSLGLLSGSQVFECSAGDFVTGYANQSSGQTRSKFEEALGQVLFIDEAYRLNPKDGGPYMKEVLDEIVQILTEPKFHGKMVVILAGYDRQVEELMTTNPGLKSRFSEKLCFPDFNATDACALLRMQLAREYGLELCAEAEAALPGCMEELIAMPGWSNGRDVGTWVKRIFRSHAKFMSGNSAAGQGSVPDSQAVSLQALRTSLDDFKATKASAAPPAAPGAEATTAAFAQMAQAFATAPPPPAPAAATATRTATAAPAIELITDWEDVDVQAEVTVAAQQPAGKDAGFGGLSNEFLKAMQTSLEDQGFDLTSASIMQELADDPSLPASLLSALRAAATGITDPAVLTEMVKQWQRAIQEQLEQEKELAKKRQRPVWRCAVCGRYGCRFAPYIERYEEF